MKGVGGGGCRLFCLFVLLFFDVICCCCCCFASNGASPFCFALYQRKGRKGRLVTYLILLPHIPRLFVTSQTHC